MKEQRLRQAPLSDSSETFYDCNARPSVHH